MKITLFLSGNMLCFEIYQAQACAKPLQPCPTLCNPVDCSPPGSSVPGVLQAWILEWVALPSPGDLPDPGIKLTSLTSPALESRFFTTSTTVIRATLLLLLLLSRFSRVRLCATPQTAAHQAPLSLRFSRQEHWRSCHFLLLLLIRVSIIYLLSKLLLLTHFKFICPFTFKVTSCRLHIVE